MKKIIFILIFFIGGIELSTFAQKVKHTQSREELEKQRVAIIEEIKRTQEELKLLQLDKRSTLEQYKILQSKLQARQTLVQNINTEIEYIESNIQLTNQDVTKLKTAFDTLKKQYAEMVRYTYKNRTSYDMMIFLFSSQTFNDAIRRMQYVKQYRNYRAQQAEKIISAGTALNKKLLVLNQQKSLKDIVLVAQQQQNKILEAETFEKNKLVTEIKGREKELLIALARQKKSADELNNAVAAIIKKEIELARKKAIEERLKRERENKLRIENEKRIAAEKLRIEKENRIAVAEKQKREEQERKYAIAKKLQEEKEKQAAAEKLKREEQERKLLAEQKLREERERKLIAEQKLREEQEKKAAKLAQQEREEREKILALEKQRQKEREQQLALEKQKQQDLERQLALEKQKQQERERQLAITREQQEKDRQRIANANRNVSYNNPRFVQVKKKDDNQFGNVTLDVGKKNTEQNEEIVASATVPKRTKPIDDISYGLTPEEQQLSANFESNKGRLPWPVEKGFIYEHFGKNKHPIFNISTDNFGVDIKTGRAATARSIFAGEVKSVIYIPGRGQNIIIYHGTFFTVISKLDKVYVNKGDRVNMKQSIGTVMTDDDGNNLIHLEIWKVSPTGSAVKLNPEQWIAQ